MIDGSATKATTVILHATSEPKPTHDAGVIAKEETSGTNEEAKKVCSEVPELCAFKAHGDAQERGRMYIERWRGEGMKENKERDQVLKLQ